MIKIKGFSSPQPIRDFHVSLTAGGLTTWVELFSKPDGSGQTSLITGDTKELLAMFEGVVAAIKGHDARLRYEMMDSETLDEEVHDAKAQEASEINNSGRETQIKYLIEGVYS